jgi:hypothetical protein
MSQHIVEDGKFSQTEKKSESEFSDQGQTVNHIFCLEVLQHMRGKVRLDKQALLHDIASAHAALLLR